MLRFSSIVTVAWIDFGAANTVLQTYQVKVKLFPTSMCRENIENSPKSRKNNVLNLGASALLNKQ